MSEIAGGNLIFEKSADISMESEDLTLSPDRVTVKYVFKNLSNKPIAGLVSFPLPTMSSVRNYRIGVEAFEGQKDPLHFILTENGKTKPFEIKAVRTHVSHDGVRYDLSVNYVWSQVFPPKETVVLSHQFKPVLGQDSELDLNSNFDENTKMAYCMDERFLKSYEKLKANMQENHLQFDYGMDLRTHLYYESIFHLAFILKTANNWAGPIKKFKLRIIKDKPSTLVSLCWNGFKKVSNVQFESRKENFAPDSDIKVLFVEEK